MKKLLACLPFLAIMLPIIAQIPGTKTVGPIVILDSITVNENDTLMLGIGSDPRTGDFVFIYQPANYLLGSPEYKLDKINSGMKVTIKYFKKITGKLGKKFLAVVNADGLYNQAVELEPAIKAGEIVAINGRDLTKRDTKPIIKSDNSGSKADEIIKMKKLLDEGIITQEEFEVQKKKILESE